ncbi:guanine-N(7)--methyltransferase subunit TRM82 [Polyplosphaeria fusca]|uniref:Guanine-N(7)--methyltransferase subunit TRM82 n=1 Tax=Polyplosphaeria fusca TaxID=682080 RepID=A0A9P4V895_9PLEO|nr:guanine-N(7)--methyltransferase subunit TRM82 [Polyplosphaeria fusca]
MNFPYQCLEACNRSTGDRNEWLLFGGCGSDLVIQSSSGESSVWPPQKDESDVVDEPQEPPGKKIKLSPSNERTSTFACLKVSNDKKHVVAITSEDKYIRVFKIDSKCRLQQLSERCMARRPCALALTPDDETILCADKFGDVYALPLIAPADDGQNGTEPGEATDTAPQKEFSPAASILTVHSGSNRKVLEEQMKQASKGKVKTKEPLKFKHDLLLGHVSMLTDIAFTTVDGKGYILTADRDEHIRISRGPPQAHIIERFCQGHDEFVSRLCLTASGLLVSGGGDPDLLIWDWMKSRLLQKVCIRNAISAHLKGQAHLTTRVPEDEDTFKIAVSGIWHKPDSQQEDSFLVACEGIPALVYVKLGPQVLLETIGLKGNALDVSFIQLSDSTWTVVVSVDNVHNPGSTTEVREDELDAELDWFDRRAPAMTRNAQSRDAGTGGETGGGSSRRVDEKAVRNVLYGIENLRKRAGGDEQE